MNPFHCVSAMQCNARLNILSLSLKNIFVRVSLQCWAHPLQDFQLKRWESKDQLSRFTFCLNCSSPLLVFCGTCSFYYKPGMWILNQYGLHMTTHLYILPPALWSCTLCCIWWLFTGLQVIQSYHTYISHFFFQELLSLCNVPFILCVYQDGAEAQELSFAVTFLPFLLLAIWHVLN